MINLIYFSDFYFFLHSISVQFLVLRSRCVSGVCWYIAFIEWKFCWWSKWLLLSYTKLSVWTAIRMLNSIQKSYSIININHLFIIFSWSVRLKYGLRNLTRAISIHRQQCHSLYHQLTYLLWQHLLPPICHQRLHRQRLQHLNQLHLLSEKLILKEKDTVILGRPFHSVFHRLIYHLLR